MSSGTMKWKVDGAFCQDDEYLIFLFPEYIILISRLYQAGIQSLQPLTLQEKEQQKIFAWVANFLKQLRFRIPGRPATLNCFFFCQTVKETSLHIRQKEPERPRAISFRYHSLHSSAAGWLWCVVPSADFRCLGLIVRSAQVGAANIIDRWLDTSCSSAVRMSRQQR